MSRITLKTLCALRRQNKSNATQSDKQSAMGVLKKQLVGLASDSRVASWRNVLASGKWHWYFERTKDPSTMRDSISKSMESWKSNGPSSVAQMQITRREREGHGKVEQNPIGELQIQCYFQWGAIKLLEQGNLTWKDSEGSSNPKKLRPSCVASPTGSNLGH